MKKLAILFYFLFFISYSLFSQNVGIGTNTPHSSALLDVSSSNKGVVLPRMSSNQRNAIANPVKGMLVYDTVHSNYFYHDGGRWLPLYQRNYDSAIVDHSSSASNVTNLPVSTTGTNVNISGSINSGFIYDNGGAAGNYSASTNSSVAISKDDTTLHIKIDVEEMDAELFYDSLFIISPGVDTIGLSGNETGNYIINTDVKILFKANNIQQFAGFKIRWARVKANTALQLPTSPYGWHFEIKKLAAMGGLPQQNNWHADSVGYGSFSYGIGVKAKGATSVALGRSSKATGDNGTVAIGWLTVASGNYGAVAIGDQSKATGNSGATAFGQQTTASGNNGATAMGYYSVASGWQGAIAMGDHPTASGNTSTALGYYTNASGNYSTAMGVTTTASGTYSTAMGYLTNASGTSSTALGVETKSKSFAGTVIGTFNDSTNAANPNAFNSANRIFQIGNGTANNARSNAMTVLQNGNIGIGELAPAVPLNFSSVLGNKISLWGNGANHYGLGIQGSLLQVYASDASADIAFGYGNSASFTERMRIKGNGNVGIGTNNPLQKLDVNGNASFNDNTIFLRSGTNPNYGLKYTNTADGPYLFGFNGGALGTADLPHSLVWHWTGAVNIKSHLIVGDGLTIDTANDNNGDLTNILKFGGGPTGEGIGSKRTAGGNQYGIDFYTGGSNRLSITNGGTVAVMNNLTVQNGKGIIRSTDGTQQKKLNTTVIINTSFTAGETKTFAITWPEAFSGNPDAFVGSVVSGSGGWAELVLSITTPNSTGATLYAYNPKSVSVTPNFGIRIIAIGPQ